MKKLAVLLAFLCLQSFAQKNELGKVTIQELQEKVCPMDSSAVAAVLFSKGETKFEFYEDRGFVYVTRVSSKIKVYKKEGYEWANKSMRFYSGSNTTAREKVSISEAVTYNLVNGKIEKSKLKSSGEFDEKVNEFWSVKKATLPDVRIGSILEFEYIFISDAISSIDPWYFQSSIPVLFSQYTTLIPEYFFYKPAFRGFNAPRITTDKNSKTIRYTSKERSAGSAGVPTSISNETFNYIENKTVYTYENLEAIKDEAYVNNIKNYVNSVEFELEATKYPNQPFKSLSTDWETIIKKIYENSDFGAELNSKGYFEKDLDPILQGASSAEDKLIRVLTFVKTTMNWDNFMGYSCKLGVKKAYKEKSGNVADINLMLLAMLRYAGLDCDPVLVSTRDNGVSMFPSRSAFNYVIAGVSINGSIYLLDATNKYSIPNILPIRDLNWYGRIIRKDGQSTQIGLMPKFNSKEVINMMVEITPSGEVSGKVRDQYFDYNAFVYRDNYNGILKESMVDKLEKRYTGIEISDYESQNNNDLGKPIIENYNFVSNNAVEIIGSKMYFSPLFHFTTKENPFKLEKRMYPVDFVFPNSDKFMVSIKIPDGYAVESLPQSAAVSLPEDYGSFKYNISASNNMIQVVFSYDLNVAILGSEIYETLKEFYNQMVTKQTEKIVLKKI